MKILLTFAFILLLISCDNSEERVINSEIDNVWETELENNMILDTNDLENWDNLDF